MKTPPNSGPPEPFFGDPRKPRHPAWVSFSWALAYLAVAITVAALIAYPIHRGLDLPISFPRLVNRLGLGLLIIGIFPARKIIGLSLAEMGFPGSWRSFSVQFGKGFLIGTGILALAILVLIALDVRSVLQTEIDRSDRLFHNLFGAIRTGVIVSILEETLFRGLLFGALLKYGSPRTAFLITAFFYAGLHFIGGHGEIPADALHWTSGLELVPGALFQVFDPANFDSFLALFVVSLFLSLVLVESPRGIAYCMGLHAAWVFLLKLTKRYTEVVPDSPRAFLVGNYDGIIGYLVAGWLLAITLLYYRRIRKQRAVSQNAMNP
ncbi:MAG: CPBP family intramembrane glutamic endopeptidase [Gammaproteobacteria bacterium]